MKKITVVLYCFMVIVILILVKIRADCPGQEDKYRINKIELRLKDYLVMSDILDIFKKEINPLKEKIKTLEYQIEILRTQVNQLSPLLENAPKIK